MNMTAAQYDQLMGGLIAIGFVTFTLAFIAYQIQRKSKEIIEEAPFVPPSEFPKPQPKIEMKQAVANNPVHEKRHEISSDRSQPIHMPYVPSLGVGAGFRFGFGFAAGVTVFWIMFVFLFWSVIGGVILNAIAQANPLHFPR